jgi:hypothetical protein
MGAEIAEPVCLPLWNSLRAGCWIQAHGLVRVEEALARDSVAIATANVRAGTVTVAGALAPPVGVVAHAGAGRGRPPEAA